MVDLRQVDRADRALHRIQPTGQVMQAGNGQRSGKSDHCAVVTHFFGKIGGFVHAMGLLVQYRLRGKPKRPNCKSERRTRAKVSDTA